MARQAGSLSSASQASAIWRIRSMSKKLCGGRRISMVTTLLPSRSTPMSLNGPIHSSRHKIERHEDAVRIETIVGEWRRDHKSEVRVERPGRCKCLHRAGLQAEPPVAAGPCLIDNLT